VRSTLGSSWLDYEHFNTVVVQGTTVVLARRASIGGSETIESHFCFNVLSVTTDGSGAALKWVGYRELPFPNELLPVGMEIVSVLTTNGDNHLVPVTDAGGRFCAVPFREFIYVFRLSTESTLLSTRFRLTREGSTSTPDRVSYSLESPWEVRFQAREKPDDQGVQHHLSLSQEQFCEPTFELSMVRGLSAESFDVEIVPVAGGGAMCHVFDVLPGESKSRMFSLPIDECGQYDLRGLG